VGGARRAAPRRDGAGVEQGWLTLLRGHRAAGRPRPGRARFTRRAARAIGHDCGAIDVEMMALALEGLAYVCEGEVEEGMRRL
jgi:hypothetical protein